MADRYGMDILSDDPHRSRKPRSTEMAAEIGAVVEDPQSVRRRRRSCRRWASNSKTGRDGVRVFPLGPGFWFEGKPVILTAPVRAAQ